MNDSDYSKQPRLLLHDAGARRAREAELIDALDHIYKMAVAATTQTKRIRRIASRARAAIDGRPWEEHAPRV